ncbi:HAMP domain-containing protein [Pseudomonas sp. B21-015]|uniref:sensor histidine kinase n=1 Tax=Pseudomonas sp. B21-015 TaxID=2895473 RepID=UPI00215FB07E|nr:ATP-binding protein [Pseudomonas sp. B21-015]UVM53085.1 HAMP domain-containing protein [Pseudomonas sp. B21-015]
MSCTPRTVVAGWTHQPEKDELFFIQDGPGAMALDTELAALAPGFQEILYAGTKYYAMVNMVGGRKYVLLRDRRSVEQREQVLFSVVVVGFVLSSLLAVVLGRLLARRVMAPVIRLARQVRHRDQLLEMDPALHPDYAVDEVGELALSFDQTLGRLREALGREKRIEFIYDDEHISSDRHNVTFLQSVMGNLLRNAWHYTDHGYIRLTLRAHGFSVEDSGIGIPKEKRQAMFQPFVRGDERRGEGLGLGLSLVQRICTHQNWRVELSSLQPNGCCFTVELEGA